MPGAEVDVRGVCSLASLVETDPDLGVSAVPNSMVLVHSIDRCVLSLLPVR